MSKQQQLQALLSPTLPLQRTSRAASFARTAPFSRGFGHCVTQRCHEKQLQLRPFRIEQLNYLQQHASKSPNRDCCEFQMRLYFSRGTTSSHRAGPFKRGCSNANALLLGC